MSGYGLYQNMWKSILEYINKTGREVTLEDYYQKIIDELYHFIPYDAAHILIHNKNNEFSEFITVNIEQKIVDDYIQHFQYIDPIKNNRFNTISATKSSLIFDYRKWKQTDYYKNFLDIHNFHYLCGVDIHYQDNILITLTLIRSQKSGDFNTAEILFLNRLRQNIGNHIHLLTELNPENFKSNRHIKMRYKKNMDALNFTPREKEIVRLVKAGLTNKDIGRDLFISVNTVKKHLQNIYEKSNVSSKQELIIKLYEL